MNEETLDHVMVTGRCYWGRGKTLDDAVMASRWLRVGDEVTVYRCSEGARVDEFGAGYGDMLKVGTGKLKRKEGKYIAMIAVE